MDAARFTLEPSSIQDSSGSIRISDTFYRLRMGKRMLLMGVLFIGLAVALGAEDGYFETLSKADNVPIYVLGVFFLIFSILMPIRGFFQLARRNIMIVNQEITEVEFVSTMFGKTALSEKVAIKDLAPNVQEALEALVHVLRAERPDFVESPDSEILFQGTIPVRIQVVVAGTLNRVAGLTPNDDFVDLPVKIYPEAIVINGEFVDSRLVGLGSFIPVSAPREEKHTHDVRVSMDSGRLERIETNRKGFVLIFLPAPQIYTDFPRAKEVHLTLRPDVETAEAVQGALNQFREFGTTRFGSVEFSVLALGRRQFIEQNDDVDAPDDDASQTDENTEEGSPDGHAE